MSKKEQIKIALDEIKRGTAEVIDINRIENLVTEVKKREFTGLLLVGKSDLDFIVEHACRKAGVEWIKNEKKDEGVFILYSESYIPDEESIKPNSAFLQNVLIK